jgi:hypothetical protein
VYIIECKWDGVDSSTIKQLLRYRDALLADWGAFEKRVAACRGRRVRPLRRSIVLVALGYRCHVALRDQDEAVETVVYKYEPNTFARMLGPDFEDDPVSAWYNG